MHSFVGLRKGGKFFNFDFSDCTVNFNGYYELVYSYLAENVLTRPLKNI